MVIINTVNGVCSVLQVDPRKASKKNTKLYIKEEVF